MNQNPDLIFIFADQQHYQAVGCRDRHFSTPNWDRFAAEAMVFNTAYCTTPLCSPSRASLMTGMMPHRAGVENNGQPLEHPSIAPKLQEAGYRTAYFGKWHLRDREVATKGWDQEQGVYDEYSAPNRPLDDQETLDFARDYIGQVELDKPFAMFVSFDEPHGVYWADPDGAYPREFMDEPVLHDETRLPTSWKEQDPEELAVDLQKLHSSKTHRYAQAMGEDETAWRRYREIYRDRVALFDKRLGELLSVIEARGLYENSIIVLTSDHGDMDAHHRLCFKGPLIYEQVQRVPLAIRVPERFGGIGPMVREDLVSLLDLYPTLLDMAGTSDERAEGISLKPVLCDSAQSHKREQCVIEYPEPRIRTLRRGKLKYSVYPGLGEFLFDLEDDPEELKNLVGEKEFAGAKKEMRAALEAWMREHDDPGLQSLDET
ncbi:MAG: sulfatase [Candidatus Sumerlaeota bacterium]